DVCCIASSKVMAICQERETRAYWLKVELFLSKNMPEKRKMSAEDLANHIENNQGSDRPDSWALFLKGFYYIGLFPLMLIIETAKILHQRAVNRGEEKKFIDALKDE
ncbi:MAG: hypothetical protein WAU07_05820, partial [Microgenomates group bacterium]